MNASLKRLLLRVGVKLMVLISTGVVGYTLLSSVSETQAPPEQPVVLRLKLSANITGTLSRIHWRGGNLIMLKRNDDLVKHLSALNAELLDPQSQHSRQPEGLPATSRSQEPSLFIAYDRGTDMGCPLVWVDAGARAAPIQPWPGGLRDTCRGSWYDAAGRVFKGQQAERNLDIPPYRLIDQDLLEIGVTGDNPASTM